MAQEAIIEAPNPATGDGAPDDGVRRRDFINIAAVTFAGVGGLAALYPLVSQMAPSADVLAESSTEIDISSIQPGQAIKAVWRKQPVFIRNLTPAEIALADKVSVATLRDPQTLAERTKEGKKNWLITMGVCTHLGCVPPGRWRRRDQGRVRRIFLPLPRLGLRYRGADPQRPRAQEPRGAGIRLQFRYRGQDRLRIDTR
nr:ubiquinol-cytochrome c reductase iron-sulfur subunit [Novosphingobium sp. Gsoil 351]